MCEREGWKKEREIFESVECIFEVWEEDDDGQTPVGQQQCIEFLFLNIFLQKRERERQTERDTEREREREREWGWV